jgi:disulfide bond formation protein DsbB
LEALAVTLPNTATPPTDHTPPAPQAGSVASVLVWAALVVSALGLAGSLYLSLWMGLKACPLCFYQRTFMMSLVAVLGVGLVTGTGRGGRLTLLALPLATAGLGVALFHVGLEATGKLECPEGIRGWGTSPQQGLVAFLVVFASLFVDALWSIKIGTARAPVVIGVLVLGALLAVGSCTANPPMPPTPSVPYKAAPDICRPPFHGA